MMLQRGSINRWMKLFQEASMMNIPDIRGWVEGREQGNLIQGAMELVGRMEDGCLLIERWFLQLWEGEDGNGEGKRKKLKFFLPSLEKVFRPK